MAKHAGGRPTKYSNKVISDALDYIKNFKNYDDLFPSIAGLACVLGVRRETLHVWANEKPEFSNIIKSLSENQERELLRGGTSGAFNSTICKLVLAKQGYSDRVEQDITSKGESIQGIVREIVK